MTWLTSCLAAAPADYGYSYEVETATISPVVWIIYIAVIVLVVAGFWKVFTKAGKPGWAAIVPIYNMMVLAEVAGKPSWWGLLCLIPIVNLVIIIILDIEVAKRFGKDGGFAVGLILLAPVFYPILGFGSAQYQPAA